MTKVNGDYLLTTLQKSIQQNSIIPNEEPFAALLADELRTLGVEPTWHEVAPGRPNVYASVDLGSSDKFMMMTGHSDTVDIAEGWETDPFDPVIKDGKLYGLGSYDMKSGVICALAAFKALIEDSALHGKLGRVGFSATVDEEGYGLGAHEMLKTEFGQCDAILLGEPFYGISKQRPLPIGITGKVLYKLTVKGKMTHGFHPERGINAVEDAAKIVAALDQLDIGTHPSYGSGNYSTLKFEGGYKEYAIVVPEHCEVVITRLTVPGESRASALADMERLVDSLALASDVTIETPPPFYEPYLIDPDSNFKQVFDQAYAGVMGTAPHYAFMQAITDANIYVPDGNIQTINFGPLGAGAHECNEHVVVDSLAKVAQIFVDTTIGYLK